MKFVTWKASTRSHSKGFFFPWHYIFLDMVFCLSRASPAAKDANTLHMQKWFYQKFKIKFMYFLCNFLWFLIAKLIRNNYIVGDLSTGKHCFIFLILWNISHEKFIEERDLGGGFQNPLEIPHVAEVLRPMTPGACQQITLHRDCCWVVTQKWIYHTAAHGGSGLCMVTVTTWLLSQNDSGKTSSSREVLCAYHVRGSWGSIQTLFHGSHCPEGRNKQANNKKIT